MNDILTDILNKLTANETHAGKIYVAREYSKADLIKDLKRLLETKGEQHER